MNNINNLKPFPRFCVTLGMIPTSYKESMTYEEQLLWLCNYIETEIIPKYNENVEAINELITLYNQLKEYVDNYFENLDIQTEINNKLDEMAESGELEAIIAAYLKVNGILGFNNIEDLEAAENVINGSICYIIGETTYNDGKGAYYKIRTITSEDVIDHFNIVTVAADNTLIGERLPNYYINSINTEITNINNEIETLTNKKWIFIGDSYSEGYSPDGTVTSWSTILKSYLGLDNNHCLIVDAGGAGFANTSNKYEDMINNLTSDTEVTDILIAGGYNDLSYGKSSIITGMTTCKTLINQKFPNAKIHVAFIGGSINEIHGEIYLKKSYYIEGCNSLHINYLPNLEFVLFNSLLFSSDGIHPNQNGQDALGNALYQALNGGYNYVAFNDIVLDPSDSDHFTGNTISLHLYSSNNISYLSNYGNNIYLTAAQNFSLSNNGSVKIGKITKYGIVGSKYYTNSYFNIGNVIIQSYSNPAGYYNVPAQLYIDTDGYVYILLQPNINDAHDNYQGFEAVHQIQIPIFNITYQTDTL